MLWYRCSPYIALFWNDKQQYKIWLQIFVKHFLVFMPQKDEFLKVLDQDIEEGSEYWTVTMKYKALKTLKMKIFNIIKYIM